jgi:hypothetical protein
MREITALEVERMTKNGTFNSHFPPQKKSRVAIPEPKTMKRVDMNTLPIKQYLIERLEITPGNLTLLCATGCSGKTMLVQYIAACVSSGTPLFGQFPVKKGSVVHVDQEQSELQTLVRLLRLANGLEIEDFDVSRTTLTERLDSPNLNPKEVEEELIETCTGKVLCIIDSLKAVSCSDENSAGIEVILKTFKRVAERTKCSIICVHHKGKGKDAKQSGRGHSSIYDSCDVQIDLEASNDIFEISCAKNRDGKYFDGIKYNMVDAGPFCVGQNCTEQLKLIALQTDVKSIKQGQREKVISCLKDSAELKFNQLFLLVKGDRNKLIEVLEDMFQADEVTMTPGPHNAKLYSLSANFRATENWS